MKIRDLSYLLRFMKRQPALLATALLLTVADVFFALMMPWLMSRIVDEGVLTGNLGMVERTSLQMVGMALGGSLTGFLSALVISLVTQRVSNDMRKSVFGKIQSLSYRQLSAYSSGVLVTRVMSDTQLVSQFGAAFFQAFLKPMAMFVLGLAMTLAVSPRFALVFAVILPLQALILVLFMKKMTPLFLKTQLIIERMNERVQEMLGSLRLIRVSMQQARENSSFGETNQELLEVNLQIQALMALLNPLVMLIINFVLILIILIGSRLVQAGTAEVGRIIAVIMYIQQIMMSLMMIGQIYQMYSRTVVSSRRLEEIEDMRPSMAEGTLTLEAPVERIEVRDAVFRYPGTPEDHPPALDRVSLDLRRGEFFAVIGPTGSGKSTLAALLARLLPASSGAVLVNGRDILHYTDASLRSHVAIVLQQSSITSGTVADNIRYGLESASPEEVTRAAALAQADSFISALPQGYDTPVSQRGASLSGGQKQGIAVARALLRRPDVLILDDSTSAMDLDTERRLREALRSACPDMTLIVISQRVATVMHADRILLMEHGRVSASGTHRSLRSQSGLYREICAAQNIPEETP